MCDYILENQDLFHGKNVLELGSGLGLSGIVVSKLGIASKVVMTDGDSKVLNTLRYNVEQNFHNDNDDDKDADDTKTTTKIVCPQLIWGKALSQFQYQYGKADIILATDCIYMPQSLQPMWKTVDELLLNADTSTVTQGIFIYVNLCTSQASIEQVLEVSTSYDFVYETRTSTKTTKDDIYIFRRRE